MRKRRDGSVLGSPPSYGFGTQIYNSLMKSQRKVVAIGAGALVCVGMLGVRWWVEGADAETLAPRTV